MYRFLLAIVALLVVYRYQYILDIIALPKNMPIVLGVIVIVIIMLNRRNEKSKFDARLVSDSMEKPERRRETKVRTGADGRKWQLHWSQNENPDPETNVMRDTDGRLWEMHWRQKK